MNWNIKMANNVVVEPSNGIIHQASSNDSSDDEDNDGVDEDGDSRPGADTYAFCLFIIDIVSFIELSLSHHQQRRLYRQLLQSPLSFHNSKKL
jgi:hypothetical protein